MSDTLTVVARMIAAPGAAELLQKEMTQLVADTRQEAGCLKYVLHRGQDNPDVFVFVEEWESRALWEAHMKGPAIRAFNERIGEDKFASCEAHALIVVA